MFSFPSFGRLLIHFEYIVTIFVVCVTYRRVLDWWPDLLHTYTPCYYISQTTIWHTITSLLYHLRLSSPETPSIKIPESESESLYDLRFTVNQFVLVPSLLRPTTSNIFQLNPCGHSPYVTSSLTRGWVCRFYICYWPSLAQGFSGPSPAGFMTIFYCLRFETPPTSWVGSPYLYHPETGWPSFTPRHWVSFSTFFCIIPVKVKIILRLAVDSQPVRLGAKLLETHNQVSFIFQLSRRGNSPYVTTSLTRGWVCLL
jgi:hypothetical protein